MEVVITTSQYSQHHNVPPEIKVKTFNLASEGQKAEAYYRQHYEIAESSGGMYAVGITISSNL